MVKCRERNTIISLEEFKTAFCHTPEFDCKKGIRSYFGSVYFNKDGNQKEFEDIGLNTTTMEFWRSNGKGAVMSSSPLKDD
jgi:hypothetical protein